jgi:hypothetical protein
MHFVNALRQRLRERAIVRFMRQVDDENLAFDARYDTDTAEEVPLERYDIDLGEERLHGTWCYQGVHENALRSIIDALVPQPGDYDFIDIGSGKGKALLVASTYPFKHVRGVELSPRLHTIALDNWSSFASSKMVRCSDVASTCQDARRLTEIGDKTFLFMFNPLSPEPMREFIAQLEVLSARQASSVMIAYLAPRARAALDESSVLQLLLETNRLLVYGTEGATLPDGAQARLSAYFNSWKP